MITVEMQQRILQLLQKKDLKVINNRKDVFKQAQYQEQWIKGEISNFEYLILVNTYAGRTYNDLNQYFVFPWVLQDYTSKVIDLTQEKDNNPVFRPLHKPLGSINQENYNAINERFQNSSPKDLPIYFMYGSHYSHSALIYNFLVRLEPFAHLHYKLQNMRFDHANRLFHSVKAQWECSTSSTQDVQELIPEFFYLAEFLKNKNQIQLGVLDCGDTIENVSLPSWVSSQTPEEFIFIMRQSLESEFVSKFLPNWIDLIFGFKSRGQAAVKAKNLFFYLTYEEGLQYHANDDEGTKQGVNEQIYLYGQTPMQLFDKPHNFRTIKSTKVFPQSIFQFEQATLLMRFQKPILKIFHVSCQSLIFLIQGLQIIMMNLSENPKLKQDIQSHQVQSVKQVTLSKILSENETIEEKFLLVQQSSHKSILSMLVVAGHIDSSIKFYSTQDLKLLFSLTFHRKATTCLYYCPQSQLLVVGSKDTRISLWKVNLVDSTMVHPHPYNVIYGHHCEVRLIAVNETLGVIISYDISGIILMHTFPKGRYLREFFIDKFVENNENDSIKQIQIHPNGILFFLTKLSRIFVYTYNGDLYLQLDVFYNSEEKITRIELTHQLTAEILIHTTNGAIWIADLFLIKKNAPQNMVEFVKTSLKKKYNLNDMEVYLESGQKVKLKNLQDKLNPESSFMVTPINYSLITKENEIRSLVVGYNCGQVLVLNEIQQIENDEDDFGKDRKGYEMIVY